jgi:hydroxymethylpyrimidine pyrophosphatase-like HAD family hydrolase|tara:strand:+ start:360 stop:731 length:372 start_codon:yes stop_codon:yes gene_type:complete
MMEKKSTIFCDIDGTIFKYRKFETYESSSPEVCPSVKEKLQQWKDEGHMILLTTARPFDMYSHTEKELAVNDIPYDRLIMEIERGPRVLINDMDPNKPGQRAMGVNLIRDEGFEGIDWTKYKL